RAYPVSLVFASARPCNATMRNPVGSTAMLLGLGLGVLLALARCEPAPLSIVTYNIENFPKHDAQIESAFRTLAGLDAPVVAVQEITDANALKHAARTELGSDWKVVVSSDQLAVGLIYDSDRLSSSDAREHEIGGRKVLEVRLEPRRGPDLRVFVVHLKAGGRDHVNTRRKQLDALA